MSPKELARLLEQFKWDRLKGFCGSIHSTLIGFISSEWVGSSAGDRILDGAPSPETGRGRTGQRNADLVLCSGGWPLIVVEVETNVDSYLGKIDTLEEYLNSARFRGMEFGLLVMVNADSSETGYKHNWSEVKDEVMSRGLPVGLVSIEWEEPHLGDDVVSRLRADSINSSWDIVNVEYWVHKEEVIEEGTLT